MQQYQNQPSLPPPQPNPNAIAVPAIVSQGLVVQDIQTYFQQYENLLAGFVPNVDILPRTDRTQRSKPEYQFPNGSNSSRNDPSIT